MLLLVFVIYYRQLSSKFKNGALNYITPVPLLGNMDRLALGLEHYTDYLLRTYYAFPNDRFVGTFEFTRPAVFIRDIELVKRIAIKDFEHFLDHRTVVDDKVDPFWGRSLFSLKGQEWKHMRSTLSPAFTSSKIRLMVPMMTEVGELMVQSITQRIQESKTGYLVIAAKELTSRFATDVIASCAFGLKVDSQREDNTFFLMSKDAGTFKFRAIIVFFAYNAFPKLITKLNLSVISKKTSKFFRALLSKTFSERQSKNIIRPDMIHLLLEAKKGKLSHDVKEKDTAVGFATVEESAVGKQQNVQVDWSEDDLIAQALLFLIGGFETASSGMAFALHELAQNPDVQEKLFKEIKEYNARKNGELDFNTIQSMVYMDMVISEVMRLWSAGFILDRTCTMDYNLGKPNKDAKHDYIVKKGDSILFPIWAFHRDPQFFPNPEKFDPERFSEENKHNFNSHAYMPFGVGPRNCIGSRFALCEIKAIVYQILLHFEVSPTEKAELKLKKNIFGTLACNDKLKFTLRE